MRVLTIDESSPYHKIVGVGGIGSGIFFALDGNHTLRRNESRAAALLPVRDYCKLHIVLHYVAKLLGAGKSSFRVVPIGNVGDDEHGHRLLQEMADTGMDVSCLSVTAGKPTLFSVCFQYPDGEGGNLTANNSAAADLSANEVNIYTEKLFADEGTRTLALAVPEVSLEARHHFLQRATEAGAYRAASFLAEEIADARRSGAFALLDLVSLNSSEAAELVGRKVSANRDEFVDTCLEFLQSGFPQLGMVVTSGKDGAFAFSRGSFVYCPAYDVEIGSTAGAGDALLGGVLSALAAGVPLLKARKSENQLSSALELGVLLASFKCQSEHTIHPSASLDDLIQFAGTKGLQLDAFLSAAS